MTSLNKVALYSKKYAPEILTGIGIGTHVASNILFVRAEKLYLEDGKKSHFMLPCIMSAASMTSIIFSNRLSNTQKASLLAGSSALFAKYVSDRKALKQNNGEINVAEIDLKRFMDSADKANLELDEDDDSQDAQLFYIEEYGIMFISSMSKVMTAELNINELFVHRGESTLKEFFDSLEIPLSDVDKDAYNQIGWRFNWDDYDAGLQYITFNNYMKLVPYDGKMIPCHFIYFNEEALPMHEWGRVYDDTDE